MPIHVYYYVLLREPISQFGIRLQQHKAQPKAIAKPNERNLKWRAKLAEFFGFGQCSFVESLCAAVTRCPANRLRCFRRLNRRYDFRGCLRRFWCRNELPFECRMSRCGRAHFTFTYSQHTRCIHLLWLCYANSVPISWQPCHLMRTGAKLLIFCFSGSARHHKSVPQNPIANSFPWLDTFAFVLVKAVETNWRLSHHIALMIAISSNSSHNGIS